MKLREDFQKRERELLKNLIVLRKIINEKDAEKQNIVVSEESSQLLAQQQEAQIPRSNN